MYRGAARSQNAQRATSFSAILADRQKQRPGQNSKARTPQPAKGKLSTVSKLEEHQAATALSQLRADVAAAKARRLARIRSG